MSAHQWVGAFTSRLDDDQAARYARMVNATRGAGRVPKLDWPGVVTDVYCAHCRRSWGQVGDECVPMMPRYRPHIPASAEQRQEVS